MSQQTVSMRDVDVIVTNFKRRYTGIMSTMVNLVPVQSQTLKLAVLGHRFDERWPMCSWLSLLRHGWSKPASDKPFRIWHCRRNHEMLVGVVLKALGMKLRLLFTSAAQRNHTQWTKWLLRRMDHVIATSPESGSYLEIPYTVNMHGIDTHTYCPAEDRAKLWAQTELPGKYGIGVFGRVRHQKGTDRFVDLMIKLLPSRPDWTAIIIGQIKSSESEFVEELKTRIEGAGLSDRILLLGIQPADKVPFWLRAMTIVVGPQRNEGFGLVPAEAAASGAAVVGTDVGAAKYLIKEGQTGYLCGIDDMEKMQQNLAELMDDPKKPEVFGQQGVEFIRRDFSVQREADGIARIYKQIQNIK